MRRGQRRSARPLSRFGISLSVPAVATPIAPDASPLVVGGGPAGAALVIALSRRGLRSTVVDPRGLSASPNTICAFFDQLPGEYVAEQFARTIVVTADGELDLDRPYARLDGAALALSAKQHATIVVDAIAGHQEGRRVQTRSAWIDASVVVDASGHRPVLIAQSPSKSSAMQSAFGLLVHGRDKALAPGTALFMDWRPSGVDDGGPPSFLYALASDDGRLLLEETTLAANVVVAPDLLERRLEERLRRRGTRIDEIIDEEVVAFPMESGLPVAGQDVVAFGAAAGFVQPISGYSVARSFAQAPVVADIIADGLLAGQAPSVIAAAVAAKSSSSSLLQLRALQGHGLAALCAFDVADCNAFFQAFFELPTDRWRGFLDGTSTLAQAQRTMWQLFREGSPRMRAQLATGAGIGRTIETVVTYARAGFGRAGGRA